MFWWCHGNIFNLSRKTNGVSSIFVFPTDWMHSLQNWTCTCYLHPFNFVFFLRLWAWIPRDLSEIWNFLYGFIFHLRELLNFMATTGGGIIDPSYSRVLVGQRPRTRGIGPYQTPWTPNTFENQNNDKWKQSVQNPHIAMEDPAIPRSTCCINPTSFLPKAIEIPKYEISTENISLYFQHM